MVSVYNWTGIYLGINGGYTFGKQDPLSLISNNYSAFDYNANGWLVGGTFGAQIQSGHVVMGIEGDIDWTNIKGSGSGAVAFLGNPGTGDPFIERFVHKHVKDAGWLRIRQLAVLRNCRRCRDKSLVHRHPNCWIGLRRSNTPSCTSKSSLHPGLAAGLGVEYGITPNMSAKFEWVWIGAGAGNTLYENMMRAGLNYRFGG